MTDKNIELYEKMFSEHMESGMKSFSESQNILKSELMKYSLDNILISFFISSLWLPNISSPVKHSFLYLILVTIDEKDFKQSGESLDYGKFSSFLKKIYGLLPSFPSVEDYIPEPDWGEIKYCIGNNLYKFFYGNELSNVYEYLSLFEIVFCAYDDKFIEILERSPLKEMKISLQLQDYIINNLRCEFDTNKLNINSGHIEIPSKKFYDSSLEFLSKLNAQSLVSPRILETFSYSFKGEKSNKFDWDSFGNMIHSGDFLSYYFIFSKGVYYPILPRRYTTVLFESWSKLFQMHYDKLKIDEDGINFKISTKVYKFFKKRIMTDSLFPVASAAFEGSRPHSLIYDFIFISKDRLILVKLLPPFYSRDQIEQFLERHLPQFTESLELIKKHPVTLALHLKKQNIQFHNSEDGKELIPKLIIIVPQVSTSIFGVEFNKSIPGKVIFLDSFLGMVDEIENVDDFSNFIDYLDENKSIMAPFFSMMDLYGSFDDSDGILIEGALTPTMVSIDPHWGTSKRFNTLKKFWALFPTIGYFDDPRSWKVEKETENRVRIVARSYLGTAIYSNKEGKHIFLTSPFSELSYEVGRMVSLLMECLEDSLELRIEIAREHAFFSQDTYNRIDILFFPLSLVIENSKFEHLKHFKLNEDIWTSDEQLIKHNHLGIRIVFDDSKMLKLFESVKDRTIETNICLEFMKRIDSFYPDEKFPEIIHKIEQTKNGLPRFKMFGRRKEAAFPDFISVHRPKTTHFKKARKHIAEICKSVGFVEGKYDLEDAKLKINKLRSKVIDKIDAEVKKFGYEDSIKFLLSRIGALLHENFRNETRAENAVTHEIDYDPNKRFAEQHEKFIREHRNFRYLIEKFVQIRPAGKNRLDKDGFMYLAALVDWILTFYASSDSIHYGLHPIGMNVTNDYLVDVELDKSVQEMEDIYGELIAKIRLGVIGNPGDKVDTGFHTKQLVEELDQAFLVDQNFTFSNMINLLQVLSQWPYYVEENTERTYYSATQEEIVKICMEITIGSSQSEIKAICEFLTLKNNEILRLSGYDDLCDDLPVWEHRKRFARYTIRPLIKIDNKYYWEPYSAVKACNIWAGRPVEGALPTDMKSPKIEKVIQRQKNKIEMDLVIKTEEILRRFTNYTNKNFKLHKVDKNGNHPIELGDYDVFGYTQKGNAILCIECKDILPAFCMKDSKRIREKIFGRTGKETGYVEQVKNRHEYMKMNYGRILDSLNWPLSETPKIISLFVSRFDYVWTMFPPEGIEISFTRIDLLSDLLSELTGDEAQ